MYDVSKFVKMHPAVFPRYFFVISAFSHETSVLFRYFLSQGPLVILEVAGTDASAHFWQFHRKEVGVSGD